MTYTETEQCLFEVITMEGLPFEENMLLIDYYKEVISEEAYRYLK